MWECELSHAHDADAVADKLAERLHRKLHPQTRPYEIPEESKIGIAAESEIKYGEKERCSN